LLCQFPETKEVWPWDDCFNAAVTPKYGTVSLGRGVLFWSVLAVSESNYDLYCRTDNSVDRKSLLSSTVGLVEEDRILNAKKRHAEADLLINKLLK